MSITLIDAMSCYIQKRHEEKKKKAKKDYEKELKQASVAKDIDAAETRYQEKLSKLIHQYQAKNWITNAAKRAYQISMATHVKKFIHSSADGSNFIFKSLGTKTEFMDSESLPFYSLDVAVKNAAALDVAAFLNLKDENNQTLQTYVDKKEIIIFQHFSQDIQEIDSWLDGFQKASAIKHPSSHTLGKQIYFPTNDDYQLLIPLYPSSLAQEIYQSIQFTYTSEMIATRDAKKKNDFSDKKIINYTNLALVNSGGSNQQNVSQLNSSRQGITYLFSSAPPCWESKLSLPHQNSVFSHFEIYKATKFHIDNLCKFLVKVNQKKIDSNERIRHFIKSKVENILDGILQIAMQWQSTEPGWSENTDLNKAQKQWLDLNEREPNNEEWLDQVSNQFGHWLVESLNQHKENKDTFKLGKVEVIEWQSLCKNVLKEMQ